MALKKSTKATTTKAETPVVAEKTTQATKIVATKTAEVKKVTFTLPKEAVENAERVALLGDFNAWNAEAATLLKKQKDGSFKTTVELETGREYQFRYLVNDTNWVNAWDADKYAATPFGVENSVVVA